MLHAQAQVQPFAARRRVKGRIHVCSKNLVFDPDDQSINILRLPLRDIASIKARAAGSQEYFVVHTRCAVEIPTHAPYMFHKLDLSKPHSEYVLSLSYVELATFLSLVQQLHALYRLPTSGAGPGTKAHALQELIRAREEKIPFESSCIVDIRERALLPGGQAILAQQVLPLLLCPGRFQLTDARIYFQNFNAISATETLVKVDVESIRRIYKRRLVMKDTALEIFIAAPSGRAASVSASSFSSSSSSSSSASAAASSSPLSQSSVYFNFSSQSVRDSVYDLLTNPALCPRCFGGGGGSPSHAPQSLASTTAAWMRGKLSNFEYLLWLNQHSGRSWLDLTQYPVFPWSVSLLPHALEPCSVLGRNVFFSLLYVCCFCLFVPSGC
jgi:factor associated with neutral sphingomyelinase activation